MNNCKILIFVFSFILSKITYAQKDSTYKFKAIDTLRVQTINKENVKPWYESNALPAFAALAITVCGFFINIYIAKNNWKNTLELAGTQNKNNTILASKQFNSTLYSNNRQEWINKVRDCISELITQCAVLNISFQENDFQRKQTAHEKVTLFRNQLRLFLSPEIAAHKKVLENLHELMNLLDLHLMKSSHPNEDFDNVGVMTLSDMLVEYGRTMLYEEWGKIQEAQAKYLY